MELELEAKEHRWTKAKARSETDISGAKCQDPGRKDTTKTLKLRV